MRIGLAQTRFPHSLADGLQLVKEMLFEAAKEGCNLVCFPESIIPGLRGVGYDIEPYDHDLQLQALEEVRAAAGNLKISVILPIEWKSELGMHIAAFVIDEQGEIAGYQPKNQIDPDEDKFNYVAGNGRHLFEVKGVKFGISICHEGWRYPETVRWAASRGASIVFHPQFTGNVPNPDFFKGAMKCRSLENNIYFASVNYALENQQISSSIISPSGELLHSAMIGLAELVTCDINPLNAHRLLAKRFRPELLQ